MSSIIDQPIFSLIACYGDDEARAIADALLRNTLITSIILEDNEIGDDGVEAIAKAMMVNSFVKKISFLGNYIKNRGAKAIASTLEGTRSLVSISLGHNMIECKGAIEISKSTDVSRFSTWAAMKLGLKEHARLPMRSALIHRLFHLICLLTI